MWALVLFYFYNYYYYLYYYYYYYYYYTSTMYYLARCTLLWGISEAGSVSRPRPALFRSGGNLSALRSIEGGAVGVRMLSRGAARTLGGSLGPL